VSEKYNTGGVDSTCTLFHQLIGISHNLKKKLCLLCTPNCEGDFSIVDEIYCEGEIYCQIEVILTLN
jgi:hypothetical protein